MNVREDEDEDEGEEELFLLSPPEAFVEKMEW